MTVPLSVEAQVIPGRQYHIKMVIADRLDTNMDSSVYIEGGSFDIGKVDLGAERCLRRLRQLFVLVTTHLIQSGLANSGYTISWTKDNVEIPNQKNLLIY